MKRVYIYHAVQIEVSVEIDTSGERSVTSRYGSGYVAVERITRAGLPASPFAPLRLGAADRRPFLNEVDALLGGYSAGRRMIDDLEGSG